MVPENKAKLLTARLPAVLMARVDFVTRNTTNDVTNRSRAVRAALEAWLGPEELRLEQLGVLKKAR